MNCRIFSWVFENYRKLTLTLGTSRYFKIHLEGENINFRILLQKNILILMQTFDSRVLYINIIVFLQPGLKFIAKNINSTVILILSLFTAK